MWDFLWCRGPSGFLCMHMCAKLKGKWLCSTAEEPWSWTMCFALRPGVFTMKRDISPPRPFINFYGERVRAGRGIPNSSRWSELTQFLTEELGEERRGREERGEERRRREEVGRRRVIRALGNTYPLKPFSRKGFSCLEARSIYIVQQLHEKLQPQRP